MLRLIQPTKRYITTSFKNIKLIKNNSLLKYNNEIINSTRLNCSSLYKENLFIQTTETPNENSLSFIPTGENVLEKGKTKQFDNVRDSYASPLAKDLFHIDGVKRVFFNDESIVINKDEDIEWSDIKLLIFSVIMEFYASGKPVLVDDKPPSDTEILPEDDEVIAGIKEILDTRVRPMVHEHNGDIEYKGFVEGVVLLKLNGACSGCSSSAITLKNGIERLLQYYIPEVISVMGVEDDDLEKTNLEAFIKTESKINEKKNNDD
eukprot:TRINITY_DN15300_c0_g1_i1.p1 TRINITY_DN15300_c0_g1~~TRINITY_DN15300_c0_g1_i1.p1  ORF type:complete len:263 (+),score=75.82 TRINITY_DN15300_c0_g1_i1:39-827(+)